MFKAARNKSGGANPVNLAGNTAGILENAFKGIIAKRGSGEKTSDVEMVVNIFNGIGEIEGWDLVSIGEALAKSLVDGQMQEGEYEVPFSAGQLSSGMYITELSAGGVVSIHKILLTK